MHPHSTTDTPTTSRKKRTSYKSWRQWRPRCTIASSLTPFLPKEDPYGGACMTDNNSPRTDELERSPTLSRRSALGVIGASAVGTSAVGVGSATAPSAEDEHDGAAYELEINTDVVVDRDGEPIGDDHDGDTELFDPEPEFPPFVNYEEMVDEHGDTAEAYLRQRGASNLLHSRRLVVHPEANGNGEMADDERDDEEMGDKDMPDEEMPDEEMAGEAVRPLTWGEYETPEVLEATVMEDGDQCSTVEIELGGLVPHGTYTMWVVHEPTYHRPLGGNDGANNTFVADEDGYGHISATDEPAELTLPPGATSDDGDEIPATAYPLHDIDEYMFVGAYHYDDRTWGPQPGPYMLTQFSLSR